MKIEDGGGFAEFDITGSTEVTLEYRSNTRIQLSLDTIHWNRIAIGVPLNADDARDLGERLIAHSVLLDPPEDD